MSVKGLDQVRGRFKLFVENAKTEMTEGAVTEMLYIGGNNAALLTPIDTNTLLNSKGAKTWSTPTGFAGSVYYGAAYAGAVHEMSGKLKGKPRGHFGATKDGKKFGGGSGKGNYWDPDAEPHFLVKGMEEMAKDSEQILKKHYRVD